MIVSSGFWLELTAAVAGVVVNVAVYKNNVLPTALAVGPFERNDNVDI